MEKRMGRRVKRENVNNPAKKRVMKTAGQFFALGRESADIRTGPRWRGDAMARSAKLSFKEMDIWRTHYWGQSSVCSLSLRSQGTWFEISPEENFEVASLKGSAEYHRWNTRIVMPPPNLLGDQSHMRGLPRRGGHWTPEKELELCSISIRKNRILWGENHEKKRWDSIITLWDRQGKTKSLKPGSDILWRRGEGLWSLMTLDNHLWKRRKESPKVTKENTEYTKISTREGSIRPMTRTPWRKKFSRLGLDQEWDIREIDQVGPRVYNKDCFTNSTRETCRST